MCFDMSTKDSDFDILIDSDNHTATQVKEADVVIDDRKPTTCFKCGFDMVEISACHLKCPNCGTEKDCSDISVW